jgi:hypothetical protein
VIRKPEHARHEAAHAVVGVYLGLRLHAVRLVGGKWVGYAHFQTPRSKRLQAGIMFAAGPAGDAISGVGDAEEWGGDFEEIADLWFSVGERRVLIDVATRYLQGPCKRAWQAVADELLHRDLTGREIKALVVDGEALES